MSSSSPSSTSINPTIAFFGATGGCTNACLTHALNNGHSAVALARTPSKLREQLARQGVAADVVTRQLVIVQGDALDVEAVKRTLTAGAAPPGNLVSTIVSGLGGSPKLQFSLGSPLRLFTLDNPTVCESAAQTLLTGLQQLYAERPAATKPSLTFISVTGIAPNNTPPDVPLPMRFLYRRVLAVPHTDKRRMEAVFRGDESRRLFRSITGVRPTLLTGAAGLVSEGVGVDKVRAGTEPRPAVGYSVRKADVGHWIFDRLIKDGPGSRWEGEMVTLTS